jgi:hypothetical protein
MKKVLLSLALSFLCLTSYALEVSAWVTSVDTKVGPEGNDIVCCWHLLIVIETDDGDFVASGTSTVAGVENCCPSSEPLSTGDPEVDAFLESATVQNAIDAAIEIERQQLGYSSLEIIPMENEKNMFRLKFEVKEVGDYQVRVKPFAAPFGEKYEKRLTIKSLGTEEVSLNLSNILGVAPQNVYFVTIKGPTDKYKGLFSLK